MGRTIQAKGKAGAKVKNIPAKRQKEEAKPQS